MGIKDLIKAIGDEGASLLAERSNSAEITGFIDTGSYMLNMLLSGDMFNGLPDNKILGIAGDPATGKTYIAQSIAANLQRKDSEAIVDYGDSESSVTRDSFADRGCDPERVIITEKRTIEAYRFHLDKLVAAYKKLKDKPKMMVVLDSLGGLISEKLVTDTAEGKAVADPGRRAQLIKQTFQLYTLELALLGIPMVVTNHVYITIGAYIPTKEMAGGGGLRYFADYIIFLSKSKVRDKATKEVTGIEVTVTNYKNRLARENASVDIYIDYKTGLDRYYGLLEVAVESGLVELKGSHYQFPDGRKVNGRKEIDQNPADFFTEPLLQDLNKVLKPKYTYGNK